MTANFLADANANPGVVPQVATNPVAPQVTPDPAPPVIALNTALLNTGLLD